MEAKKKVSSSMEDYLESILEVIEQKGAARATDIARKRSVANSSVTSALRKLVGLGLVNHDLYGEITLTGKGLEVARGVTLRHRVFSDFLVQVLSVDRKTAEECACRLEHVIPQEVAQRFIGYLELEKKCMYRQWRWIEGRGFVCDMEQCGGKNEATLIGNPGVGDERHA